MESTYVTNYSTASSSSSADPVALAAIFIAFGIYMLVVLAISIVSVIALWKLFEKAHKPGWASIVPIYNYVILLEVIGRPMWWLAMMFIPIVNIVFMFLIFIDLAKSFGKDTTYGVLLVLFSPVTLPMLAFSKHTTYTGPAGPERHASTPLV